MKFPFFRLPLASILALAATALLAADASVNVYNRPATDAQVIVTLPATGFLPLNSDPAQTNLPSGWMAVSIPGPHKLYVANKDILKDMDIRPNAAYLLKPESDSPVYTHATDDDGAEITGLHGRWTEILLRGPVTGYIQTGSEKPGSVEPASTLPATVDTSSTVAPQPSTTPSVANTAPAPTPAPATATGKAVEVSNNNLPRLFQGVLVSTKVPFRPRRPYDYQINDSSGEKYAYLDLSRLLLTDNIENFIGHTVVIYGIAEAKAGTGDIVIKVESIQGK